jgi:hypothetical protein
MNLPGRVRLGLRKEAPTSGAEALVIALIKRGLAPEHVMAATALALELESTPACPPNKAEAA